MAATGIASGLSPPGCSTAGHLELATLAVTRTIKQCAGDSYIMDPGGEILVRSRRHTEDFIMLDADSSRGPDMSFGLSKSAWSYREFGKLMEEAAKE